MGIDNALWITEKNGCEAPVFRKSFSVFSIKKAELDICGLGWFLLYINGKKVSDDLFCPAVSTYENIKGKRIIYPLSDKFSSPRVYYLRYNITDMIKNGKNLMSVQLGNGFFNQYLRTAEGDLAVGKPRLAFSLKLIGKDGNVTEVISDSSVIAGESQIIENNLFYGEVHDMKKKGGFHSEGFNEEGFAPAVLCDAPEGELTLFDYPKDRLIRKITPRLIAGSDDKKLYDLGENISGRLCFDTVEGFCGEIKTEYSEEIKKDDELDFSSTDYGDQVQRFTVMCDGKVHKNIHPQFSWQAFRYFTISGRADNLICEVIHTDIKQTGFFECDNSIINSIFEIYKRSQLDNIHGCVPSDCPHRERLGYTGDGQITCETVMHIFDAREMYAKWMQDICDCQNAENGHVQHTAPFFGGGGGPAGWGGAIIILPYTYYKMYGSPRLILPYIHAMTAYLEYMESRCDMGIVTREEDGGWCLGDWFMEGSDEQKALLAPAYVNTYYLIRFYKIMLWLDEKLGLGLNREKYRLAKEEHKKALIKNFYSEKTGDFCQNACGANAFAVDIGLGDERTLRHLVEKYSEFGGFDTGIFGTEVLARVFSENGYTELLYKLLTSERENASFGYMLSRGATTLWEDWRGENSHNHPMFGGCLKSLWTAFLGIRCLEPGYSRIKIAPCDILELGNMSGSISAPKGKISVAIKRQNGRVLIIAEIPNGTDGVLEFAGKQKTLVSGTNVFEF